MKMCGCVIRDKCVVRVIKATMLCFDRNVRDIKLCVLEINY